MATVFRLSLLSCCLQTAAALKHAYIIKNIDETGGVGIWLARREEEQRVKMVQAMHSCSLLLM